MGEVMVMRHCAFFSFVLGVVALTPQVTLAAPIVIPATQAAGPAKSQTGSGACATAVHLSSFNTLTSPAVAEFYLAQSPGTMNVDGKVDFHTSDINYRNGDPKTVADFKNPHPLPFSTLAGSVKPGNDQNIAMRVRGYLNVPSATTYTFGVQADDGYQLLIGNTLIMQSVFTGTSLHDSRQVQFSGAGLYALSLTYFQQTGAAVLALARSTQADLELTSSPTPLPASFALVDPADMFSALVGQSSCQECQTSTDCGKNNGQYCQDGLCQGCLVGDHCGMSCIRCSTTTPACDGTQCTECSPQDTQVCDAKGFLCVNNACIPCSEDDQCGTGKICDNAFGQCITRPNAQYSGGCSATAPSAPSGTSTLPLLLTLMLGLFFFVQRTGRRARLAQKLALITCLTWVGIPAASAQTANPQLATFNAQTFRPTLGTGNLFTVEGTLMPRPLWPLAGVLFEVANRPLRLVLSDTGETYAATVPVMFTAHVMAGAGFTRWFSAALALPVVLYQGFDTRTPTSDVPNLPTAAGLGDLRLLTKFRLVAKDGFGLAAVPQFTFPTGSSSSFRGDDTFGVEPRLAADYRFRNGIFIAANVGVYIRTYNRTVDFDLVRVGDQLRYGAGLGIPLRKSFAISGEVTGAVGFSKFVGGPLYTPTEWYLGAHYTIKQALELTAGVGGGLAPAVGSPNFRFFAGLTYVIPGQTPPRSPRPVAEPRPPRSSRPDSVVISTAIVAGEVPDADKDGVPDPQDRCPNEPGPADNNGCPDTDQDHDGIVDRLDQCPKQAGPREGRGCPLLEIGESSIRLGLPLKFQPGGAELSTSSRPTVAALVTFVRATPTIKKILIDVTASGSPHIAKRLAAHRAKALQDILTEAGAAEDVLAIRAVSQPGPDEITRVDLVRDANVVKPVPVPVQVVQPVQPVQLPPPPALPVAPPPVKVELPSAPAVESPARHHHHGKHSHREDGDKPRKSNKEKRSRH